MTAETLMTLLVLLAALAVLLVDAIRDYLRTGSRKHARELFAVVVFICFTSWAVTDPLTAIGWGRALHAGAATLTGW